MTGLVILGDTSGSVTLNAPAVAGNGTITLPTTGGTVRTTTTPGTVLQVIQTVIPATSFLATTGYNVDTQISGTITPTSSSNKILILMNFMIGTPTTSNAMVTGRIMRNGTEAYYIGQISGNVVGTRAVTNCAISYLDSPSTTSAVTYKLNIASVDGAEIRIGAWGYDTSWRSPTSITMMEIAG